MQVAQIVIVNRMFIKKKIYRMFIKNLQNVHKELAECP